MENSLVGVIHLVRTHEEEGKVKPKRMPGVTILFGLRGSSPYTTLFEAPDAGTYLGLFVERCIRLCPTFR